jgi:hypothetical protein
MSTSLMYYLISDKLVKEKGPWSVSVTLISLLEPYFDPDKKIIAMVGSAGMPSSFNYL